MLIISARVMNTIKFAATNRRRGNAGKIIFLKNWKKSRKNV
jgi:hypothetical protein